MRITCAGLLAALSLAGCGDTPPPDKAPRKTGPATQTVEIRGSRYVPETVTIRVGESVKWVNRDDIKLRHSATRTVADPKFDTGPLTKDDESEPVTFTHASPPEGWQYGCRTPGHDAMKGFVVVTRSSYVRGAPPLRPTPNRARARFLVRRRGLSPRAPAGAVLGDVGLEQRELLHEGVLVDAGGALEVGGEVGHEAASRRARARSAARRARSSTSGAASAESLPCQVNCIDMRAPRKPSKWM